jgi:hypothetical protein
MTTDSGEVSEAPKDLRGFSSGGESVCSNTPPRSKRSDAQGDAVLDEGRERDRLGHDVGNHTRSRDVRDRDVALLHLLADEVLRQAKVASAVVKLRVARKSVGALVVAEELDRSAGSLRKLGQELRQVDRLLRGVRETEVLCLRRRGGNARLKLG